MVDSLAESADPAVVVVETQEGPLAHARPVLVHDLVQHQRHVGVNVVRQGRADGQHEGIAPLAVQDPVLVVILRQAVDLLPGAALLPVAVQEASQLPQRGLLGQV